MLSGLPGAMTSGGSWLNRPRHSGLGAIRDLRELPALELARFGLLVLLIAVSFALGGTSGDVPFRAMTIELVAILSLMLTVATWQGPRLPWPAMAGIIFILGLPLLQLVPLPPKVWQLLPGRDVAREIAAFVDPEMWRPITLDSEATFKSWLSLLLPVAMFVGTVQLRSSLRLLLCQIVIAIALASLFLGIMQVMSGREWSYLFETEHRGLPLGVFTNRNHQAALLYVAAGMALLSARRAAPGATAERLICFSLVVAFAAGIFATESRAGMVLLFLTLLLSTPLFMLRRINWWMLSIGVASLGAVTFLLSQSGVVRDAVGRFALLSSEGRFEIWPEAWYAAKAYFPAGAGLGTFVKSYQAMEQLTTLTANYVNHAHNDYLELALELGVFAFVAVGLFLIWVVVRSFRILYREPRDEANLIARVALIAILAMLIHSAADYPIRTFAHLGLFGFLCGLVYRPFQIPALTDKLVGAEFARGEGASATSNTGTVVAFERKSTDRTSPAASA